MAFVHEEEDEPMYPTHYFMKSQTGSGWPPGHHDINDDRDRFLPAPALKRRRRHRWSWSWSFILRGRRLRMTIRAPGPLSRDDLRAFLEDILRIGPGPNLRRRGVSVGTVMDGLGVAWPALITWLLIPWWIM